MQVKGILLACAASAMALQQAALGDELDRLVEEVAPPARYAEYTPQFRVEPVVFRHVWYKRGGGGVELNEGQRQVIYDGTRPVGFVTGLCKGYGGGGFEIWTSHPGLDVSERITPRYWEQTAQIGISSGLPAPFGGAKSADEVEFDLGDGGETLKWSEHYCWRPDGKTKGLDATVRIEYTLRVDPVLGYVVEQRMDVRSNRRPSVEDAPEGGLCRMSTGCFFPRGLQNTWPDQYTYGLTVYTPAADDKHGGGERFAWFYNSGAFIEQIRHGRHYQARGDGLIGYLKDVSGWGFVETTPRTDRAIGCKTCPAYGEIFNGGHYVPEKRNDGEGWHVALSRRAAGVPPEMIEHITKVGKLRDAGGSKAIQVRMAEDFEDQPLPYATAERGIKYEPRCPGYRCEISEEEASSGQRSLLVHGVSEANAREYKVGKEHPPIRWRSWRRKYRVSCRIKVVGEGTRAFVTVREQWPDDFVKHRDGIGRTPFVEGGEGWRLVSDEFRSWQQGGSVALGFICIGPGKAYFDEFRLEEIDATPQEFEEQGDGE